MIDYSHRSYKKELLDSSQIPFRDIAENMKELDFINAHLGGHTITVAGFRELAGNNKKISVCEIGCGGGDNINVLAAFCIKNEIEAAFTGIDINADCIDFAKEKSRIDGVKFVISDYKLVNFGDSKPDIIFSSLFCHHFADDELISMLQWMKKNSTIGFFINDLQRHPLAYHSIKYITRLFSKSYLVKNDAPLSVLRGFKSGEWKNIFEKAGITNYSIQWKWAFRFLIVVPNHRPKNSLDEG
ncbi:MAG: methyltransferase domain-containing protein [Ginsengibacter sp.]